MWSGSIAAAASLSCEKKQSSVAIQSSLKLNSNISGSLLPCTSQGIVLQHGS
jgi:hypothetical protein